MADALAIAWDAFTGAAGDDLAGWEVRAAAAEVRPEPPLPGAEVRSTRSAVTDSGHNADAGGVARFDGQGW